MGGTSDEGSTELRDVAQVLVVIVVSIMVSMAFCDIVLAESEYLEPRPSTGLHDLIPVESLSGVILVFASLSTV